MKRTLLLLPAIACLSLSVFAQVPVDKTVSLQSVEIQGKRFGGLTGGEVKRPAGGQQPEWSDRDDSRRIPPAAFRCDRYRGRNHVPWFQ